MTGSSGRVRLTAALLAVLSCVYFVLFIPPNLKGAHDVNMLSAFTLDEAVQYQAVMYMTRGGRSIAEAIAHFGVPGFWPYGYPFLAVSALPLIPLKLYADITQPTLFMLVLRQLSPLFTLIAVGVLCYLQTGFRSVVASVALFVFLLCVPAVFNDGMWWHPDALALLFVVLTIFALDRDDQRFGKWFYVAAAFCGLAAGTKLMGLWFFLTIAVYLGLGVATRGVRGVLRHAAGFLGVMLAAIVVTNPLLLWPRFARLIIGAMTSAVTQANSGRDIRGATGIAAWYPTLRDGFGAWWIYGLALAGCVTGMMGERRKRTLHIIILTWCVPLALATFYGSRYKPERYFLPVLVPLFSCVGSLLSVDMLRHRRRDLVLAGGVLVVLIAQTTVYISADAATYRRMNNRELESGPLNFFRELDARYLSQVPAGTRLRVFRDPYVYFPSSTNVDAHYVWRSGTYADIKSIDPDLIVLERDYVDMYSNPETTRIASEPELARSSLAFYADARDNRIDGYRKILETPFAIAFVRIAHD